MKKKNVAEEICFEKIRIVEKYVIAETRNSKMYFYDVYKLYHYLHLNLFFNS